MATIQAASSCGELESLGLEGRYSTIVDDPEACQLLDIAIDSQGLGARLGVGELAYAVGAMLPSIIDWLAGGRKNQPASEYRLADQRRQPFGAILDRLELNDLARSVAMEQRDDWRMPAGPERDRDGALKLFWEACLRSEPILKATLSGLFRHNHRVSIEDCIRDTWLAVRETYWSPEARKRFLGLTSINGILVSTAIWKAKGGLKRSQSCPTISLTGQLSDPYTSDDSPYISDILIAEIIRALLSGERFVARRFQPEPGVLGELLERHGELAALETSLAEMEGVRAEFGRYYHVEGKSNKEISELRGCEPPYVTGVLKKAWRRLGRSRSLLDALSRIERGGPRDPRGGGDEPTMDNHRSDSQPLHEPRRQPGADSRRDRRRWGSVSAIPDGILEALERLTAIREGKECLNHVDNKTLLHWISILDYDGIVAILAADASRGDAPAEAGGRGWKALTLGVFRSYLQSVIDASVHPGDRRMACFDIEGGEGSGMAGPADIRDGSSDDHVPPTLPLDNQRLGRNIRKFEENAAGRSSSGTPAAKREGRSRTIFAISSRCAAAVLLVATPVIIAGSIRYFKPTITKMLSYLTATRNSSELKEHRVPPPNLHRGGGATSRDEHVVLEPKGEVPAPDLHRGGGATPRDEPVAQQPKGEVPAPDLHRGGGATPRDEPVAQQPKGEVPAPDLHRGGGATPRDEPVAQQPKESAARGGDSFSRLGFYGSLRSIGFSTDSGQPAAMFGIDAIHQGKPADVAGLREGDVILGVDGKKFKSIKGFRQLLDASNGTVRLTVLKEGAEKPIKVTVRFKK
jgi:hypothetical protein